MVWTDSIFVDMINSNAVRGLKTEKTIKYRNVNEFELHGFFCLVHTKDWYFGIIFGIAAFWAVFMISFKGDG